MYQGYLKVILQIADGAFPLPDESVYIKTEGFTSDGNGGFLSDAEVDSQNYNYRLITDLSGATQPVSIITPDPAVSLNEFNPLVPYSVADVYTDIKGYFPVRIKGVQIFPERISTLPINLTPISDSFTGQQSGVINYTIPPNALMTETQRTPDYDSEPAATPEIADSVAIPEFITVHLGAPSQNAENVRVPFQEYIKNVASSEIFPTWNEEALRANIIAIVSLTLNRVFTEWYPSRGYDFDITSSTQFDQSFVKGRNYFDNISSLVDDLFDTYITRQGVISPLFAAYCDGRRTTCSGMSQWGSENLAREGYTALNILRNYYGNNIELKNATEIENTVSYPGYPLSLGSQGFEVEEIRRQLYRIADNYPLIPKINPVLRVFDSALDSAVRTFQEIFGLTVDGIVGKATWYRISYVYASVTKLAELTGEGETGGLPEEVPTETVQRGDSGTSVARLQLILGYIGLFYPEIASPALDGIFGSGTEQAVRDFQQYFGLPVTGIVTASDWQRLYDVYNELLERITPTLGEQSYPGSPLSVGSRGENVRLMQEYLNIISDVYTTIPKITADGIYGNATAQAVRAFQRRFFLDITGTIDAVTWGQIVEVYNFITRQE